MSLNFIAVLEKGKAAYINMSYVHNVIFENLDKPWAVPVDDKGNMHAIDATRIEIRGDSVEFLIVVARHEADALQKSMQMGGDLYQKITLTVLPEQQVKPAG